jgi:hypothetical protein
MDIILVPIRHRQIEINFLFLIIKNTITSLILNKNYKKPIDLYYLKLDIVYILLIYIISILDLIHQYILKMILSLNINFKIYILI